MYGMREVEETAEALERLIGAQAVGPRAAVRGGGGQSWFEVAGSRGRVDGIYDN